MAVGGEEEGGGGEGGRCIGYVSGIGENVIVCIW